MYTYTHVGLLTAALLFFCRQLRLAIAIAVGAGIADATLFFQCAVSFGCPESYEGWWEIVLAFHHVSHSFLVILALQTLYVCFWPRSAWPVWDNALFVGLYSHPLIDALTHGGDELCTYLFPSQQRLGEWLSVVDYRIPGTLRPTGWELGIVSVTFLVLLNRFFGKI